MRRNSIYSIGLTSSSLTQGQIQCSKHCCQASQCWHYLSLWTNRQLPLTLKDLELQRSYLRDIVPRTRFARRCSSSGRRIAIGKPPRRYRLNFNLFTELHRPPPSW